MSLDLFSNFSGTCVETNSYIQDIDSIAEVVEYQPHQHIPHLELIETCPAQKDTLRHKHLMEITATCCTKHTRMMKHQ